MTEKMGKDRDGYERFLTQLLLAACGNDAIALIDLTFHAMDGKEVCRIAVKPSPKPVWVKEGGANIFHVRTGNASRALDGPEFYDYARSHWP